jgi:hypothetical protein
MKKVDKIHACGISKTKTDEERAILLLKKIFDAWWNGEHPRLSKEEREWVTSTGISSPPGLEE